MVTIYDIAKVANVSAMTVSRVINNTGRISKETSAKVRRVMEELHYVPNFTARSLVLQETRLLSLLIPDIRNPFFTTLARGAEDAARKLGYKLLFCNSDEDIIKEREYIDTVISTQVDGVILAPAGDASAAHLQLLHRHRIPFVLIDREVPGIQSDSVLGDSKNGARQLVEHLIGLGHRRIAMINGLQSVSTARLRLAGYVEALKLNDIHLDPTLVYEVGYRHFDEHQAERLLKPLMTQDDKPTAIFAANNLLALGTVRCLRSLGLNVPGDISVVCFDELELFSPLDPFFTVCAQPAYTFGSLGTQLLVERIQTKEPGNWKKLVLPPELIIRQSANCI